MDDSQPAELRRTEAVPAHEGLMAREAEYIPAERIPMESEEFRPAERIPMESAEFVPAEPARMMPREGFTVPAEPVEMTPREGFSMPVESARVMPEGFAVPAEPVRMMPREGFTVPAERAVPAEPVQMSAREGVPLEAEPLRAREGFTVPAERAVPAEPVQMTAREGVPPEPTQLRAREGVPLQAEQVSARDGVPLEPGQLRAREGTAVGEPMAAARSAELNEVAPDGTVAAVRKDAGVPLSQTIARTPQSQAAAPDGGAGQGFQVDVDRYRAAVSPVTAAMEQVSQLGTSLSAFLSGLEGSAPWGNDESGKKFAEGEKGYLKYSKDTQDGLKSLASGLKNVADGLKQMADNYANSEESATTTFSGQDDGGQVGATPPPTYTPPASHGPYNLRPTTGRY